MTQQINPNHILDTLNIVGINRIKDIVLKSEKEKREYGFRFCKNDGIKVTKICKGDQCNLNLNHCPEENKTIGSFHTHPTNIKGKANFLSDQDIYADATDKSEFACIGLVENNIPRVKCYLPYYGMEKSIVENRNNYRDEYGIKVKEYNPGGTKGGILNLPPEKYMELVKIYHRFLLADKRLRVESSRAALRLLKEPSEGADIIINL